MTATNNAVFWSSLGFGAGFVFNILLNRKLLPNFWYKNKELMEVIFTNEPIANLRLKKFDDYYPPNLRRIIQLLNSAERSIDLAIYMFYVEVCFIIYFTLNNKFQNFTGFGKSNDRCTQPRSCNSTTGLQDPGNIFRKSVS